MILHPWTMCAVIYILHKITCQPPGTWPSGGLSQPLYPSSVSSIISSYDTYLAGVVDEAEAALLAEVRLLELGMCGMLCSQFVYEGLISCFWEETLFINQGKHTQWLQAEKKQNRNMRSQDGTSLYIKLHIPKFNNSSNPSKISSSIPTSTSIHLFFAGFLMTIITMIIIYILIPSLVRHIVSISSETAEQIFTRMVLIESSRSNADNRLAEMNQKCIYFE